MKKPVLQIQYFVISLFFLAFFLAVSYLFWLDRSFQVARSGETKEEIDARLHFVRNRRIQSTDIDFPWKDEGMIKYMLPQTDAELYEYCVGWNCFHVSYDPEGRKLNTFDTYE